MVGSCHFMLGSVFAVMKAITNPLTSAILWKGPLLKGKNVLI